MGHLPGTMGHFPGTIWHLQIVGLLSCWLSGLLDSCFWVDLAPYWCFTEIKTCLNTSSVCNYLLKILRIIEKVLLVCAIIPLNIHGNSSCLCPKHYCDCQNYHWISLNTPVFPPKYLYICPEYHSPPTNKMVFVPNTTVVYLCCYPRYHCIFPKWHRILH